MRTIKQFIKPGDELVQLRADPADQQITVARHGTKEQNRPALQLPICLLDYVEQDVALIHGPSNSCPCTPAPPVRMRTLALAPATTRQCEGGRWRTAPAL